MKNKMDYCSSNMETVLVNEIFTIFVATGRIDGRSTVRTIALPFAQSMKKNRANI